MRKFILTSAKFTGQIEIIYANDHISVIDFSKSGMDLAQKNYFLQHFHVSVNDLEQFVKDTRLTCVESDIEISFEMFWHKYNMKLDRKRTLAIWEKMSTSKKVAAFYGIDRYDGHLRKTDWRNKMEPKTYLKNERWEDEWK